MSKHWKEPLDPSHHLDFMSTYDIGGVPRQPPRDRLVPAWSYFVRVDGFTFQFASVEQLRECIAYCRKAIHPARRQGPVGRLEHYWQGWCERLPRGLLRGIKRRRVVTALERAAAEFAGSA